jgi:alkanesulfonate monooxygenase SsuD/methylene tetrahydromethanopterin reductase-like flavin-dependent oxidoreductase (luciferase family)
MALHHPIRFAEQIALVDNISKGRMIVGVGRGTAYNFYEFRGFGIDPDDSHEMLLEVEDILLQAWTTKDYKHNGKYWQLELPVLRPQVYQKPHPPMIRACSGLESTLEMAREGRPFMMNVQSDEVTVERMDQYRATMSDAGHNDETVARNVADSWVWRNIFVAETDAEAEKVGIPYFQNMRSYLQTNRDRMNTAAELEAQASRIVGSARNSLEHGIIAGSPETVTERLQKVHGTGVGGVIIHFRLGAMPYDIAANSLKLFAQKVAPNFQD